MRARNAHKENVYGSNQNFKAIVVVVGEELVFVGKISANKWMGTFELAKGRWEGRLCELCVIFYSRHLYSIYFRCVFGEKREIFIFFFFSPLFFCPISLPLPFDLSQRAARVFFLSPPYTNFSFLLLRLTKKKKKKFIKFVMCFLLLFEASAVQLPSSSIYVRSTALTPYTHTHAVAVGHIVKQKKKKKRRNTKKCVCVFN